MNGLVEGIHNLKMRVTYLDILRSRIGVDKSSFNIGWCGPYPPAKNGGAVVVARFAQEMISQRQNVFAIPSSNVCNKALLKGIKFARLQDRFLDAIFFFCAEELFRKYRDRICAKTVLFGLLHGDEFPGNKALIGDMKACDMAITSTRWAQEYFRSNGVSDIGYMPPSVDTSLFRPEEKMPGALEVIFVGRLCFYKGIKQFLSAIPLVLKEDGDTVFRIRGILDNTDLVFPYLDGENQAIYSEVKEVLKETIARYSKNIVWENKWVNFSNFNEAATIYKNADILVLPSNNEGFGVPLVEAMSCGIPCIVADKPPMNEIVVNNETGFCLALSDKEEHGLKFPEPRDIAEKIIFLKNNPQVYKRISVAARNRVKNEYELSKNTALLINAAGGRTIK